MDRIELVIREVTFGRYMLRLALVLAWFGSYAVFYLFRSHLPGDTYVLAAGFFTAGVGCLIRTFSERRVKQRFRDAAASPDIPKRGSALALIELLFSTELDREMRGQAVEIILRANQEELALHQNTLDRFARRWLRYTPLMSKSSPIHRFAAVASSRPGYMPWETQEKIRTRLAQINPTLFA